MFKIITFYYKLEELVNLNLNIVSKYSKVTFLLNYN